jgi:hypothetical protein
LIAQLALRQRQIVCSASSRFVGTHFTRITAINLIKVGRSTCTTEILRVTDAGHFTGGQTGVTNSLAPIELGHERQKYPELENIEAVLYVKWGPYILYSYQKLFHIV